MPIRTSGATALIGSGKLAGAKIGLGGDGGPAADACQGFPVGAGDPGLDGTSGLDLGQDLLSCGVGRPEHVVRPGSDRSMVFQDYTSFDNRTVLVEPGTRRILQVYD